MLADPVRVEQFLDWICSDKISESTQKRPIKPVTPSESDKPVKKTKTVLPQIFITNLPFSTTQQTLRTLLEALQIPTDSLHLGRDSLGKFQGWTLLSLPAGTEPSPFIPRLNDATFEDRVLYASLGGDKEKIKFKLPLQLIDRLRKIKDERNLSGSNAGKIADFYRREYGEKFPAEKYGFKSFVAALGSIDGLQITVDDKNNQTICHWP
jgi:hypothetical protein